MELVVDRLTKQYKNKIAVDRVSFKIKQGVYGLLGANSAGKNYACVCYNSTLSYRA